MDTKFRHQIRGSSRQGTGSATLVYSLSSVPSVPTNRTVPPPPPSSIRWELNHSRSLATNPCSRLHLVREQFVNSYHYRAEWTSSNFEKACIEKACINTRFWRTCPQKGGGLNPVHKRLPKRQVFFLQRERPRETDI